ncbi:MAG: CarD family transcriptional regulator [Deltaproteobacteria bacterium]|jgi:CarD family transcriptional regulator|nr:CarD family transcriptional regulator [Deltaproteobacteria bacterium]
MQPTFKIGDKAVYRNHGVAVITGIETIEMYGSLQNVYVLEVMDSKRDRVMIPVDKVNSVGLRSLISQEEVDEVYEILRERPGKFDQQTWNRRQRKYTEKINTGSVYDVAEVLRDLYLLKFDKTLSFGEKRMLDRAQQLLVKELAIARDMADKDVEDELASIFADAVPAGPVAVEEPEPEPEKVVEPEPVPVKAPRTRSGSRPKAKTGTLRD